MTQRMRKAALVVLALVGAVDGSGSVLARPPLGKAASGFIASESPIAGPGSSVGTTTGTKSAAAAATEPPSFVSVGIRSNCAREKAATLQRNEDGPGASAASRLRGGSTWIPHPPIKLSRADLDHSHAKVISNSNPVSSHRPTDGSSCNSRRTGSGDMSGPGAHSGGGAEFTVSRQRVVADDGFDSPSFEDEDEGLAGGSTGAGGGGGGGGGGRVGAFSLPRALPPATNGKAPINKKFAWVP